MTDQDSQYQSNQEHNNVTEGTVQPPMTEQSLENPVQPPMEDQGLENPAQPQMGDQAPENPAQPQMGDQGPENPVQPPMADQAPENSVQPPMADQGPENPAQPSMAEQGLENSAQPPMAEQAPENSVPNRGLLTLVFFVNMGLLMLFIGTAVLMGGWAIVFLFFLGYYLTCYIAATVLLGIGTKTANKTMLFVSVALYFASILFAGDPAWLAIQIPSMISTVLVLIGTLLL
ncbi:hypothetical protein [Streptococcus sp. AM43-2AT]|uniref:hypothetical protein n=1 Tax=Streptococcus sp. AM43-2AT TaxID=2293247 RepID=UPI000EE20A59|nr:hypothetical protein [Streptococcus sp. AM43-2AT]RJU24825.1 hypothetical protein DW930_01015 [Streptococcus sp. AM43-2AT]